MKFFLKIILLVLLIMVLFTLSSKAEWRLGIFFGKASTLNSDLLVKQPSKQTELLFHSIEFSDRSFKTPLYYGLRLGYFPGSYPNLGLEAEFTHAKIYSKPQQMVYVSGKREGDLIDSTIRLGEIVQDFSMSHGLNFLFCNLVGRLWFLKDKAGLYGRLGIGPLIPHTESVIEGETKEQFELHGPTYQLAAEMEINIWKKLSLLLEYKYTYVNVKDARIPYGYARTKLQTNHLIFGLGVEF